MKMKKYIISIITFIICVFLFSMIAMPHHITENRAIEAARNYILFNTDDKDLDLKLNGIKKYYISTSQGFYIENAKNENNSIIFYVKNIFDYWNPNFKYWSISFENKKNNLIYNINVDTYTGFIFESEAIKWEK